VHDKIIRVHLMHTIRTVCGAAAGFHQLSGSVDLLAGASHVECEQVLKAISREKIFLAHIEPAQARRVVIVAGVHHVLDHGAAGPPGCLVWAEEIDLARDTTRVAGGGGGSGGGVG
jgi:hypothetical protein